MVMSIIIIINIIIIIIIIIQFQFISKSGKVIWENCPNEFDSLRLLVQAKDCSLAGLFMILNEI